MTAPTQKENNLKFSVKSFSEYKHTIFLRPCFKYRLCFISDAAKLPSGEKKEESNNTQDPTFKMGNSSQ